MIDIDKRNLAVRILEEAADRGAQKGLSAEDMLQGMLSIYLYTKLGLNGYSIQELVAEVQVRAEESVRHLEGDFAVEVGPPLGEGNN